MPLRRGRQSTKVFVVYYGIFNAGNGGGRRRLGGFMTLCAEILREKTGK